jgi:hypothetical protein
MYAVCQAIGPKAGIASLSRWTLQTPDFLCAGFNPLRDHR